MPSERETSVTVIGTSGLTVSGYGSTFMTGFVDEVYVITSKAASTLFHVKITTSSTANVIYTSVPSTLGAYYRPRATAVVGGTTAAPAVHGTCEAVPISVYKERMRVSVVATSQTSATVTARMRINPLY
jgi:hypothetical protein